MPLFRAQAIAARSTQRLGDIVLIRPVSFSFLTVLAVILALIVCAFLRWGTYTRHSTVSGQLLPDTGLIKIHVPQAGIVIEKHVAEGRHVEAGEVLYVLSSERSSILGATQQAISAQVAQREASLRDEMQKTGQLQQTERLELGDKIAGLNSERAKLTALIAGQHARVELAQQALSRYQGLLQQDYVSREQYQQKQEELLDQDNRRQSLERDRIVLERELSAQQSALSGLALKHQNQLAQIARALSSVGQELSESEAKRRLVVSAPQAGIATAVIADVGQTVDGSRPLASVVPDGAILRAELYAPSRAIGFVRPGDPVLIRFQAYPYQKFGHRKGTVISVSRTALSGNELNGALNAAANNNSEPMYRVTVELETQTVAAYGRAQALQSGMLLEADIRQETLHLYEWVLEPLTSLTGKL